MLPHDLAGTKSWEILTVARRIYRTIADGGEVKHRRWSGRAFMFERGSVTVRSWNRESTTDILVIARCSRVSYQHKEVQPRRSKGNTFVGEKDYPFRC